MRILVDTNVVLRMADKGHPMHGQALSAIEFLDSNQHECVIVPQVLYEYWVVATRPIENNGLGMTTTNTDLAISKWITLFHLLLDERDIFPIWRDLVTSNDVKGKTAHDARLIAAMQRHGVTNLLSFNKPDFIRFNAIRVFTPAEVLAGQINV
ncbi:MAG: type II toxin-antitoxin system VapC family toxin [Planctomycetota bacterium]